MGSGFMLPGDVVAVPFGCSTPILFRQEGSDKEYRFVGDVDIDEYMHRLAVDEWREKQRPAEKYVVH